MGTTLDVNGAVRELAGHFETGVASRIIDGFGIGNGLGPALIGGKPYGFAIGQAVGGEHFHCAPSLAVGAA